MSESGKSPITSWAEDDRPREKLMLKGSAALSTAELIAILIGSGNTEETAVELAQRILQDSQNNLIELSRKTLHNLQQFKGIGEAKAITIAAALELGRRRQSEQALEKPVITTSVQAWQIFHEYLADNNYERFGVIFLNRANKVIAVKMLSDGGISGTVVDPKKLFKMALEQNASAMILGHNHPSGQTNPSDADIKLTNQLVQAGKLLECNVLDHIISGEQSYFSFADESLI